MKIQDTDQKVNFLDLLDVEVTFAELCRLAWPSYDAMCADLNAVDIPVCETTCKSYRNGSSEPRKTRGDAIEALAEYRIDQNERLRRERMQRHRQRRARLG